MNKSSSFFEIPAQFDILFSNCEHHNVFLLAVLADVTPMRATLDGRIQPAKVTLQQVSFRGVNIIQDLSPNQLDCIEAAVLEQLERSDMSREEETSPLTAEDGPLGAGG